MSFFILAVRSLILIFVCVSSPFKIVGFMKLMIAFEIISQPYSIAQSSKTQISNI